MGPGVIFADYELLEEIARGGMGIVYKARQRSLNRIVALKMILAGQLASTGQVERFRAEARAVAYLQHPNIVAIHEVGEADGQDYFSMDYVEGRNLADLLREGPMVGRQAALYLRTIAEAVQHAHQHGIIHRDLKPSNVLIDGNKQPRITDFGLAKRLAVPPSGGPGTDRPAEAGPTHELTLSGQVLGSPNYLPPEQAGGTHVAVGPASDVYSLGAILYHLLTGRPPFQGESLSTLIRQVLETEPVAPRLLNPSVPRDLETICLKCLEKEADRRYPTAQELADDLGRFLEQQPIRARRVRGWERALKWARRKPMVAGLAGAVVLVTALGFVGVMWQWRAALDARRAALRAEQDAEEKLAVSYLAQARANRWSGRSGRRFDSLEALAKAAEIRSSLHSDPPTRLELRNEAIACLALADVKVERRFPTAHAFDSRFERYARVLSDGSIAIHQVDGDRELARLPARGKATWNQLSFSPDGHFLADRFLSAPTNRLSEYRVWDLSRRTLVLLLPLVVGVQFSPDSQFLVMLDEPGSIRFYGLATGLEERRLDLPHRPARFHFDPAGRRLALAYDVGVMVRIVDAETGQILQELDHPACVSHPAWSADGELLACPCYDSRLYLWQSRTGQRLRALEGHTAVVLAAAFNQVGDMLVSRGWDGLARFWHPAANRLLVSLPGGYVPIAFGADDRRLGCDLGENQGGIWRVEPARECRRLGLMPEGTSGAQFSPDQRLLATSSADGVRLWNVPGQQLLAHLPLRQSKCVLFHPDGRSLIVTGPEIGLRRWPLEFVGDQVQVRVGPEELLHQAALEGAALCPDGSKLIATAPEAGGVVFYELEAPGQSQLLRGHSRASFVDVSPDGKWFATCTWHASGVKVWDLQSRKPVGEWPISGSVKCRFSPDGHWLVTGSAKEYRFWRVNSWEPGLGISRDRADDMWGDLAFSPDGTTLALLHGRDTCVRLVSVSTGQELASFEEAGAPLCFSPDGGWLATKGADSQGLLVWDLRLIRRQLTAMRLDWDAPPLAPAQEDAEPARLTASVLTNRAATTSWRAEIPPRDLETGPDLIDLSRHYNASLKRNWHDAEPRHQQNNLATLPTGVQRLASVPFDLRGLIQVGDQPGMTYPRRVADIAVGRPCARLHFLHAAVHAANEGTKIGRYVVHFAGGEQVEVPIVVGKDVSNWWGPAEEQGKPLVVAWWGTNALANAFGGKIRLFKSTWENPRPADRVQSIDFDFVGNSEECAPFLVALTAE
jgi:eukaryotic-like serine/threonine-protein kinase